MVYHPWKKEEAGNQTREIMYTISLSNPLAPKTSTVSETQVHTLNVTRGHTLNITNTLHVVSNPRKMLAGGGGEPLVCQT